jgi:ribosomal-protein-alanine N-acetyltransferase
LAHLGLDGVISLTASTNVRSQAVMERIGMCHDPSSDFAHPRLAADHALTGTSPTV